MSMQMSGNIVACCLLLVLLFVPFALLTDEAPSVCIPILIRNKEHSLPYFFQALEKLDYPKEKIYLWSALDHCIDNSHLVVQKWLQRVQQLYQKVVYAPKNDPASYPDQVSDMDWPESRMKYVIDLKSAAMDYCKQVESTYVFYLDADAIIMNPETLKYLVSLDLPIVAPMLNTTGVYSNFWGDMDEMGYYKRSKDYAAIQRRHMIGAHKVPMVHSAVLVNLGKPNCRKLSFDKNLLPNAPFDDIIIFALSAKANEADMYIDNAAFYGFLPIPREGGETLKDEVVHWRELVTSRDVLQYEDLVPEPFDYDVTETSKLGFDEIYMINLVRRTDRAEKIKRLLRIFDIGYRYFPAVDGLQLNSTYLSELGVKMLEGYFDPYYDRPLKMGEIGCFLSHYFIWKDMVANNYQRILILEDDPYLVPNFNEEMQEALRDADHFVPSWDLMFVGRKILNWEGESFVEGTSRLVYPDYSHWTVAYALTLSGAKKFLSENPIAKMVAVDEYIPIMYDRNDNEQWLPHFHNRNVIALSVEPLLIHPQLYTNQEGYYSDTEASSVIDATLSESEKPNVAHDYSHASEL